MRAYAILTWVHFKLYLREPVSTFFTVLFPPLLVVLFGAMYGNEPSALFGGYGSMDISMPAYTALILGTVGLMGVPITTSGYREQGVLRRFRATPMRPLTYLIADVTTNLMMTLIGMLFLVLAGWLLYRVRFEGQIASVIFAVLFGGVTMFAIGYLIASVAASARMAQVVGMVIFYPMMFLSGASVPLEVMPPGIQRVSEFLPLTYVVRLLRGVWFGGRVIDQASDLLVLGAIFSASTILAVRFFRWE
jgi:ABC-2 type transport system permease protein